MKRDPKEQPAAAQIAEFLENEVQGIASLRADVGKLQGQIAQLQERVTRLEKSDN